MTETNYAKVLYELNIAPEVTASANAILKAAPEVSEVLSSPVVSLKEKFSGTSKGFGFVEMSSEEKATQAIAKLNGSNLDGRKIRVSEATENKKH